MKKKVLQNNNILLLLYLDKEINYIKLLAKKKVKSINFKQIKTFILLKQKTNILKNIFVITRLKQQVCVISTKTILITKIIN